MFNFNKDPKMKKCFIKLVISLTALISAPVYATAPETNELLFYGYTNTIVKSANFTPLGHYISSGELYGGVGTNANPNAIDIYANRYNTAETVQWVANKMLTVNKVPWQSDYMLTTYSDSIFFKDDAPQELNFAVYGTLTLKLVFENQTQLLNCYNVILAQGYTSSFLGATSDDNWWIFANKKIYYDYLPNSIILTCIDVNDAALKEIVIDRPTFNNEGNMDTSQDYPKDARSLHNLFLISTSLY